MWHVWKLVAQKSKASSVNKLLVRRYATSQSSNTGGAKRVLITLVAVTGVGAGVAVAYGKYDPKFRKLIEENIPYSDQLFKSLPDFGISKEKPTKEIASDSKAKETSIEGSLLKKKQERLKKDVKSSVEPEVKASDIAKLPEVTKSDPESSSITNRVIIDEKSTKPSVNEEIPQKYDDYAAIENSIKELMLKLDRTAKEAITLQETAVDSVKDHTSKLYQALDAPEGMASDGIWKEAELAGSKEASALKVTAQKVSDSRAIIERLKIEVKKGRDNSAAMKSPLIYAGEEKINKIEQDLQNSENKVSAAQVEAKTASDYKELVKKAREQFKNELKIVLPKYLNKDKEQSMTEDELNLLIAHAHRRIENLQKEIARQQVTEKQRVDEALHMQRFHDDRSVELQIATEILRHERKLKMEFKARLDSIRDDFEADMRQQLRRQAAAHADHLQEALQVQQQELHRKYIMEVEEKLLHQKGIFISDISESLSRLKGIEAYMKASSESDASARKAQALWVACQAMKDALKANISEGPNPLAKELALLKKAAGDENAFVAAIVAGIPSEAVQRGVYTNEYLKNRFEKVKHICRRVAMIDDNHRSLYRYFLSYLQSFFIVDVAHVPIAELQGKVAVDPSEWDTFDILSRVSFCLQKNDFEQALRYANQLKGEPRNVARDWISEVRLLLETVQAVDSLLTYAAAVGIQAYH